MRGLALLATALVAAPSWAAPAIEVPAHLSVPRPQIQVIGLVAGGEAVLTVERRAPDGQTVLAGEQRFAVPADGRLLLDTADEYAAFWRASRRPAAAADPAPGMARLRVRDAGGEAAVEVPARPDKAALDIIRDTPFPGALLVKPTGAGPLPVIIVLGGSEGGSSTAETFAPMIAAEGFAVLGLPYVNGFGGPAITGLPTAFSELPVDRLEEVRRWLLARDDVDGRRIGLWGVSKGAEFAAIAASRFPWVKAVAAIVPSDVVWEGWGRPPPQSASFAFAGQPLPFVPYHEIEAEFAKIAQGGRPDLLRAHVEGRARHPDRIAAARIPMERSRAPMLLVGGGADPTWPSLAMAEAMAASRAKAGRRTILIGDPDGGHGLAGPGLDPVSAAAGGTAAANARVRLEAWAATFDLFRAALR